MLVDTLAQELERNPSVDHYRRVRGDARNFKGVPAAGGDENIFEFLNNLAPFARRGASGCTAETVVSAPL